MRAAEGWAADRVDRLAAEASAAYAARNAHKPWVKSGRVPTGLTVAERAVAKAAHEEMTRTSFVGYAALPGVAVYPEVAREEPLGE